jgi:predicted amidohydrolase YtcJ
VNLKNSPVKNPDAKLKNPYDSHVHWLHTGLVSTALSLGSLKSPEEARLLPRQPNRGCWLLGYGWDKNQWPASSAPTCAALADIPVHVAFTSGDGHALWVNREAINAAGGDKAFQKFSDEMCPRDGEGRLTGLLLDSAMTPVLNVVPKPTALETEQALRSAVSYFNRRGFTHIRDLSCNEDQWQASARLEERGELTLAVEQYFDALPYRDFDQALGEARRAREHGTRLRRVRGIKVFFDGALGSEGALIGCCYPSGRRGLQLMTEQELSESARRTWAEGFRLAVHMIGDEAAEKAVDLFLRLKDEGVTGPLDFEHCELVREETLFKLAALDVTAHMQPCHWLGDRRWLEEKLLENRARLFPWAKIEALGKTLHFGSDAPFAPAGIEHNEEALRDGAFHDIPAPRFPAWHYQSHPDSEWVPGCWAEQSTSGVRVCFDGKVQEYLS